MTKIYYNPNIITKSSITMWLAKIFIRTIELDFFTLTRFTYFKETGVV